jgi:hypothetical protein
VDRKANRSHEFGEEYDSSNTLWQYVQSLSPEAIAQLSKPESPEVFGVMERNIVGLLGLLPSDRFDIQISTSREHLGQLLASAIMSGYFLRNAEQRLNFEQILERCERKFSDCE